jgi:MYXO-CTERM domain-containing protein
MPDDAPGLCPSGQTCVLGSCVASCFEGTCADGYTCDPVHGVCVETACLTVTCAADERCVGGTCVNACDGIVCPHGQQCISGACVDPCAAVTCDVDRVCRDGLCVLRCPCSPCPTGETCLSDGTCIARGCDIVLCPDGEYCESSTCHDACEGVMCPHGQTCITGRCMLPPPRDAGPPPVDAGMDAGVVEVPDAFMEIDASHGPPNPHDEPRSGCGCHVGGSQDRPWGGLALGLGVAIVLARRRTRR